MCAMPVMPRDGDWTVDDLRDLPDDGLQYELADGVLLVTPSPRPRHQRMSGRLFVLLVNACPPELEVFHAPLDYQPTRTRSLQPDLMVVRREDVGEESITLPPLLVVEILSPSTRAKDLVLKKALYADGGIPSYWVLDPSEGSAIAWELAASGEYEEVARAQGAETVILSEPYRVTFAPADLVR